MWFKNLRDGGSISGHDSSAGCGSEYSKAGEGLLHGIRSRRGTTICLAARLWFVTILHLQNVL